MASLAWGVQTWPPRPPTDGRRGAHSTFEISTRGVVIRQLSALSASPRRPHFTALFDRDADRWTATTACTSYHMRPLKFSWDLGRRNPWCSYLHVTQTRRESAEPETDPGTAPLTVHCGLTEPPHNTAAAGTADVAYTANASIHYLVYIELAAPPRHTDLSAQTTDETRRVHGGYGT